jgi:hypothetical protein
VSSVELTETKTTDPILRSVEKISDNSSWFSELCLHDFMVGCCLLYQHILNYNLMHCDRFFVQLHTLKL